MTSYIKTTTGRHSEERVSLSLPGLAEEDENGDQESDEQSLRGSARLLKNLHMDIESLGGEYEESEPSEGIKEVPKSNSELGTTDFRIGVKSFEKVHDIASLSPRPASPKQEAIDNDFDEEVEEEIDDDDDDDNMEPVKELQDKTQRQLPPDAKHTGATVEPKSTINFSSDVFRNGNESSQNSEKESRNVFEISKLTEEPPKLIDQLPKTSDDNSRIILEQEKSALEEKHRQMLEDLTEMFSKQEEEKKRALQELHNSSMRALEERLQKESEEEEARMREAQKERLLKLEKELLKEREEEEQKTRKQELEIREEHRQRLLKLEENLLKDKNALSENLKLETENILEQERANILHERELALKELSSKLEDETRKALELLESKHVLQLEQLKASATEKHQKEMSEVSQAPRSLHLNNKKMSHILDFEKEMSDLLQEKRNEVQREHEKKLECMKEEHRQEMEKIRNQFEKEEQTQRSQMLEKLQDDLGKLGRQYEQELEEQRKEQERRQEERQRSYKEKEKIIEDLEQNQEIRRKQLMVKKRQLDNEEETIRKRNEELEEKKKELERKLENVNVQESAVKEQKFLSDLIKETQRELEAMQSQKSELQTKVEQLQSLYSRLQETASDLEGEIKSRHEKLKEIRKEEMLNKMDSELHLEDLTKIHSPNQTHNIPDQTDFANPPLSSTPVPTVPSAMDDLRYYISSQGASIHKAKDFLRLQTHSMCRRQTLLKAAKQQWRHNMHESQDREQDHQLEGIRRNLEEEARNLKDIHDTMEKGQVLLQQKEHCLQELESSLLEEVSEEEIQKARRSKKLVTFDVSDSDDTSSVLSMDKHKCDGLASLNCLPLKVKQLTQSLHHITTELNSVLTTLDPHMSDPNALFHSGNKFSSTPGIPISAYLSMSKSDHQRGLRSASPWALKSSASPGVSASSSATQSVNALMMEKWHKYFPGSSPFLRDQSLHSENKYGYISAGEQLREMRSASLHSKYTDKNNIQAMIDNNKKWLQNFKHDPKVPLGPPRSPGGVGLVQLGLDENNQIRVYQY